MKKLVSLILIIVLIGLMTIVSKASDTVNILGAWNVVSIKSNEDSGLLGLAIAPENSTVVFYEDGKVTFNLSFGSENGTYEVSGDTITVHYNGRTTTTTYVEGSNKLNLSYGSYQVELSKVTVIQNSSSLEVPQNDEVSVGENNEETNRENIEQEKQQSQQQEIKKSDKTISSNPKLPRTGKNSIGMVIIMGIIVFGALFLIKEKSIKLE